MERRHWRDVKTIGSIGPVHLIVAPVLDFRPCHDVSLLEIDKLAKKSNSQNDVERSSASAFTASTDEEAIEALTDLNGVGVPVASSMLTMYDPTQYAVIDFRAFRALGAIRYGLIDAQNYSTYGEFMNNFRSYNTQSEAYSFYMDQARQIASGEGLVPREADMALRAFDKAN